MLSYKIYLPLTLSCHCCVAEDSHLGEPSYPRHWNCFGFCHQFPEAPTRTGRKGKCKIEKCRKYKSCQDVKWKPDVAGVGGI